MRFIHLVIFTLKFIYPITVELSVQEGPVETIQYMLGVIKL